VIARRVADVLLLLHGVVRSLCDGIMTNQWPAQPTINDRPKSVLKAAPRLALSVRTCCVSPTFRLVIELPAWFWTIAEGAA